MFAAASRIGTSRWQDVASVLRQRVCVIRDEDDRLPRQLRLPARLPAIYRRGCVHRNAVTPPSAAAETLSAWPFHRAADVDNQCLVQHRLRSAQRWRPPECPRQWRPPTTRAPAPPGCRSTRWIVASGQRLHRARCCRHLHGLDHEVGASEQVLSQRDRCTSLPVGPRDIDAQPEVERQRQAVEPRPEVGAGRGRE
jgi:hypothetical protein